VSTGPDSADLTALDDRTRERLLKASHRDREVYRVLRDQALAAVAANRHSAAHASRGQLDVFLDRVGVAAK
jgi:hypothetical protein